MTIFTSIYIYITYKVLFAILVIVVFVKRIFLNKIKIDKLLLEIN